MNFIILKKRRVWLCYITVITAVILRLAEGCNAPDGTQVTVSITEPSATKLVMRSTGSLLTTCTASSSGGDDGQLTWIIHPDVFQWPNGESGISVDINTPNQWPEEASSLVFGLHVIRLAYVGGSEDGCSAVLGCNVYFDPVIMIGSERAWFYYWKQVVPMSLINTLQYGGNSSTFDAVTWYGAGHGPDTVIYDSAAGSGLPDIQEYVKTIAHENRHIEIKNEQWGVGFVNLDEDLDIDGDEYRDEWELGPVGSLYGFTVIPGDSRDAYTDCAGSSAGSRYESAECALAEASADVTQYNESDWSEGGAQW